MGTELAYLLEQYIVNRTQEEICKAIGINPATLSRAKLKEAGLVETLQLH